MRYFLLLCSLVLWSCQRAPKTQNNRSSNKSVAPEINEQEDNYITCWGIGPVEFGDDISALEEKVGKENITLDSLFLEGDFDRLITKVWKGSPKEISISWLEEKPPFKNIKALEISHPDSPYKFNNGIKIGTSIRKIVELNGGEDIKLYGFGWDYGGTFVDFGKGNLKGDLPCFGGVFELQTEAAGKEVEEVFGDQEISSSAPAFKKYEAVLSVIRVFNKS